MVLMAQSPTGFSENWKCLGGGDCCELFAQFTIGAKKCPMLKDDRSCGCYANRPKFCRVDSFEIEGLDKNEYLIARCHFIHMLKKWKDEVGDNKSVEYILEKISKSGLK